jgi:hypothetical protein
LVGVDSDQSRASGSVEAWLIRDRTLGVKHEVVEECRIRLCAFDDLFQSLVRARFVLIVGHVSSY